MRLDNEDTWKDLQLVPESHDMDVPSACTIVIIAGNSNRCFKKLYLKSLFIFR